MARLTDQSDYATDADWTEASRRAIVLNKLIGTRRCSGTDIIIAAEELGLSISRLYDILRAYRKTGDATCLLPKHPGGKAGSTKLHPDVEVIIEQCIQEFVLKRTKMSGRRLLQEIGPACANASLPKPSLGTVQNRIAKIALRTKVNAQRGKKAADDRFRPVVGTYKAIQALEKTQIDHTLADVIIVDDYLRMPIGRPWVSMAIDIASRDVLSYYITLTPPSRISVAMTMALMTIDIGRELGVPEKMLGTPCTGIPDLVHFDNAREFHSNSMKYGCAKHGIEMRYRPVATPHYGGHIERLIGTHMGEVHLLPGTTFSNVQERGDYQSERHAAMTLSEFSQWFALEVIHYRNTIHSSLHRPPIAVWEELVRKRPTIIRQPTDPSRYLVDFLPYKMCSVRRDGIRLFNLFYWGEILAALAGQCPQKLMVRYDPRNMSQIYVEDPDREIWPIPLRDPRRPAISLWEHTQACRALREKGLREYNEDLIFEIISRQREIVKNSIAKSKRARRNMVRLVNDLTLDSAVLPHKAIGGGESVAKEPSGVVGSTPPLRGFEVEDD